MNNVVALPKEEERKQAVSEQILKSHYQRKADKLKQYSKLLQGMFIEGLMDGIDVKVLRNQIEIYETTALEYELMIEGE